MALKYHAKGTPPLSRDRMRQLVDSAAVRGVPILLWVHDTVRNVDHLLDPGREAVEAVAAEVGRLRQYKVMRPFHTDAPFDIQWDSF